MTTNVVAKKIPSILVTDARDWPQTATASAGFSRSGIRASDVVRQRMSTKSISVDNVLQHASEIPSGQARMLPPRKPSLPKRPNGALVTRLAPQKVPGRSTKVTEKLVLIPDTGEGLGEEDENETIRFTSKYEEEETEPLKDDEWDLLKKRGKVRGKSYAERLSKAKRAEELARVTAYCTAQGYKTKATASFVKNTHGAKTKLYDDCLYTAYHLPLLPGTQGYRIRSSPVLKNPGGKAVLDEEIERSEQRDYHEGYFENTSTYSVRGEDAGHDQGKKDEIHQKEESRFIRNIAMPAARVRRQSSPNQMSPVSTTFAEMFVFSYGVVVFWNFTERQEKDVLADLTFSDHKTATSLVVRPLEQDDFETEEFHFEYSPFVDRPRVFNDMITLRSGDHMIKLAMSHAVAQSTKLSLFEERMNQTMLNAQHVPKHLALTGQLGMSRSQIFKILGNLFKTRVEVNLSSNILDVPNFFWESEPTLHPLYFAIREYLEIAPRIKVLNERCKVFLELAEILSNSIADTKMSTITWIIIVLIIISIAVTVTEVALRSMILEKGKPSEILNIHQFPSMSLTNRNFSTAQLQHICGEAYLSKMYADDEL